MPLDATSDRSGVGATRQLLRALLIISCAAALEGDGNVRWDYGHGSDGSNLWPSIEPRCNGTHQSPIRLQNAIFNASLQHVHFEGYHDGEGYNFTLLNNGHAAKIKLPKLYSLSGGDFRGKYIADSLHFHWGNTNNVGSEHSLNGKRYPMEMHIVHIHERYDSVAQVEVNGTSDAIAVTGFLFKIVEKDNVFLQGIINDLERIKKLDAQYQIKGFPLDNLLPAHHHYFYRYEGSLTVPSCIEKVLWTVFVDKIEISAAQIKRFRMLKDSFGHDLVDNFRPEQPLNDRIIYTNMDVNYDLLDDSSNQGKNTKSSIVLCILAATLAITFGFL